MRYAAGVKDVLDRTFNNKPLKKDDVIVEVCTALVPEPRFHHYIACAYALSTAEQGQPCNHVCLACIMMHWPVIACHWSICLRYVDEHTKAWTRA